MDTLSCHSDESAMAMQNTNFAEATPCRRQPINRPDSLLHNTTSHTQCLYQISKLLSSAAPEKSLLEKQGLHKGTHTNIVTEKTKSIFPLYTSYARGIIILNISVKYQLYWHYGFWRDDLFFIFIFFRGGGGGAVVMATNPIQQLESNFLCLEEDYSRNISLKLLSKYFQSDGKKTYFHFSHYKSMETLNYHSNKSTWAMATKNTILVEANVMKVSWKFQLHPPYDFWEDFWIFFAI